ncbi:UNVERIFIED_CONTAM: Pentatricopeptide repeat-containing protein [Sesamum calycinum]|uniref:Pentatricopeptide repeat-containing protein n=1 Tax=Sesamum calycinum TaxID=2727403 RepID=A0AAW2T0G5_9LAMI
MSNVVRSRSAHKLFDKVTKRRPASQISPNCKANISLCRKRLNLVDPFEYFNQNDLLKSWTSKISSLVREYRPEEAMGLFKAMLVNEQRPNFVTVLSVIRAVGLLGSRDLLCGIHGYSIKIGLTDSQVSIVTALIGVYSNWDTRSAWKLFNRTADKDVVLCSAMVLACELRGSTSSFQTYGEQRYHFLEDHDTWSVENEIPEKALLLFLELLACSVKRVDECIIQDVLGAYSQLDENPIREGLHSLLFKMGFTAFVSVMTELLQVYVRFGDIDSARNIFEQLKCKDVIAWTSMIAVYAQSTQPNNAFDILRQMQLADQKPNEFTFVSLLMACTSLDAKEIGESIHAQITKDGHWTNTFLTSALIDMYCKLGRTSEGQAVFMKIPAKI